jgi:D-alanyl-lipoteichoic acid acyltransferase DltB (MBOAT superfamily)
MIFNSYEFIFLFLPLVVIAYFFLIRKRLLIAAKGLLIFASLFFYSWWNITYLPLLLISLLFNYFIGNYLNGNISNFIPKKWVLIFGISANIAFLGYFKYADFFIENINKVSASSIPLLHLALPLGISFITFQKIAYLVDSYRGTTKEYNFFNYILFVSFFPQLIAGPIVHHAEIMPQFASKRNLIKQYDNLAMGAFIFAIGLFKKVVLADTFALWANSGFNAANNLTLIEAWATSLSYTFQLYFDFSGYTDMAIGSALLFNIKLPLNFNSPYKALNIQDFWRRWHMTLSRFLRDYIYIPLGGNRHGNLRMYSNILATFIIGGFWHGAGWTFIFWGALHGIALIVQRIWHNFQIKMPDVMAWFITFNFVNLAWVFFRAKTWQDAVAIIKAMFKINSLVISKLSADLLNSALNLPFYDFIGSEHNFLFSLKTSLWISVAFILVTATKNSIEIAEKKEFKVYQALFVSLSLIVFHFMSVQTTASPFLYFNF